MKQWKKRILAFVLCMVMVVSLFPQSSLVYAAGSEEYLIYPTPHEMTYQDGDYILKQNVNVIYDDGIDEATKARLVETMDLKGLTVSESDAAVKGATNVYVGINGSEGPAESYIEANYSVDASLFNETDSYFLASDDNTIVVLGRDTDASYYGLTTLYHVLAQMDSLTIRNFTVKDYADVVSRGFIEGYYGNPWSTEDRCNLMEWGGYYKLNSYFYAPKDDPKHNAEWKSLYSEEEIETKIKPLAEIGNASKCRFVYALHPYMKNPIRYSSEAAYQEDLNAMKAKFAQVIEAGVRQIAILADDAGNVGGSNYIRTLQDMTAWIKEMQKTYPDLKLTLPFCTQEYMGYGESYYANFPENVQIVMTGGRVWGEVSNNFTSTFTSRVGRGPYLWINWPCTDNSKQHLIMGGYSTFLQAGVDPSNIQGIVLNPMQQSEPSKVAIFGNACYSWNIWETNEEADAAWNASFSFVDHNTAIPNAASNALKELSKHMINQNMDDRVTALQESVELKEKLDAFKEKLATETVAVEDVDAVIAEFEVLQEAAKTYRASAGNIDTKDQIVYWLNCWDDTTEAAIAYLNGVKAAIAGDAASVLNCNVAAKTAFDRSKTYGFLYVDHTEYAEVGVQHIVPFIKTLAAYVSAKAESVVNPEVVDPEQVVVTTTVSAYGIAPKAGALDNIIDEDTTNYAHFAEYPYKVGDIQDYIPVDATVTLNFSQAIRLGSIEFKQDSGTDKLTGYAIEYSADGTDWIALNEYDGDAEVNLNLSSQNIVAKAVRVRNTELNLGSATAGYWWKLYNFNVTQYGDEPKEETSTIAATAFDNGRLNPYQGSRIANIVDGNESTYIWYEGTGEAGDYIGVNLGSSKKIGEVRVLMDAADRWLNYTLQYSTDGQSYRNYGTFTGNTLNVDLSMDNIEASHIRLYNNMGTSTWTKFYEFSVKEQSSRTDLIYTNKADLTGITASMDESSVTLDGPGSITLGAGEYIGVDLKNIKAVTDIQVPDTSVSLQTSMNTIIWSDVTGNTYGDARYVRLVNEGDTAQTITFDEMSVEFESIQEESVTSTLSLADHKKDTRSLGNVENIFDGNLTTSGIITGSQTANGQIVFDLGQEVSFESLRYYIVETNMDYLRYAAFEVANDPAAATWTRILVVGESGFENTFNETTAKDASYLTHDSSNPGYMYAEATGLNVTGRYLRVVPLETYTHRWVQFNELQINGGAYLSPEDNRDVLAEAVEERYKIPSNVLDGDYTTTYKSSAADSSFTYRISEPGQRTIRIIQNGAVSNAALTAKVYKDGSETTVPLGNLSQTINEFALPQDMQLLEVTAEWTDFIPEISIIQTTPNAADANVDKAALVAEMDKKDDAVIATWTGASQETYTAAYAVAEAVIDNAYATQSAVDMAAETLESARVNAVVKGDIEALQAAVAAKKVNDVDGVQIYSAKTYAAYADVIAQIETALEDPDNVSEKETDTLVAELQAAEAALEYSLIQRELAEVTLENDEGAYAAEDYPEALYAEYEAAKEALEQAVAEDKETRKNPLEIAGLIKDYDAAKAGLTGEAPTPGVTPTPTPGTKPGVTPTPTPGTKPGVTPTPTPGTKPGVTPTPTPGTKPGVTPTPGEKPELTFDDVNESDFHYDAVLWALENNITTGYSAEEFGTWDNCTRSQIVTFLWRAAGSPTMKSAKCPFTDVSKDAYYYDAVLWAVSEGITTGYNATTFGSEDECTRGQIVTFLWRAKGEKAPKSTECDFADINSADYFYNAVLWAVENGITTGISKTQFAPNDICTRAEAVTFLHRAFK